MASPSRLVLFVEGQGDRDSVPVLLKRLLTDLEGWSYLFLDDKPFVVGTVADLTKDNGRKWIRFLNAARKRSKLGAVLLIQDGDLARIRGEDFCAARFGTYLSQWARNTGAGKLFSVATVFACQEYESWALACIDRLAGLPFPDGRFGIRPGARGPGSNLEESPRDAKGWLGKHIDSGYKPTRDQMLLTQLMVNHLDAIRGRGLRSFRRLESALQQLVSAVRTSTHIVTPDYSPSRSVSH